MSRSRQLAPECVFCGARPTTREHVYPKWLRTVLSEPGEVRTITQIAEGDVRTRRTEIAFDVTVRAVCAGCNSGWMSRLELLLQPTLTPLLKGHAAALDQSQQQSVASWVFKTLLMIHQESGGDHSVIDRESYVHLFQTGTPPASAKVWLCSLPQAGGPTTFVGRSAIERLAFQLGTEVQPTDTRFYGASIAIGRLMCCVLGTAEGEFVPEVVSAFDPYLTRIWPTRDESSVSWPPARSTDLIGGFDGVHWRLFEQKSDCRPTVSVWGPPRSVAADIERSVEGQN